MRTESSPAVAPALPITRGSLPELTRDLFCCMRDLYRAHGNVAALEDVDGQRVVFAFGPEYNAQVLSDTETFHARFFALRGPKGSAQRRITTALLSMNGAEHKSQRRIVMAPFQKKAIEAYRDDLTSLAQQMAERWQPGAERDVFYDVTQFMLRVTSKILFGVDNPALSERLGDLIDRWVGLNHELGLGAVVSQAEHDSSYADLLRLAAELEVDVRALLDERRAAPLNDDVASLLLRASERPDGCVSDPELHGQTAIIFAAGYLTTANTLAWTLYLLAQHPDMAADLADELTSVLRGRAPSPADMERLPLLECVIKESMRILPASFYSQRMNVRSVQLGPFHLSPGTPIIFSQYITHHMPDLYPEPEHFWPGRWRTLAPSPYAYLPFGAGPRLCLGASMALSTLRIALAVVLQRCTFALVRGAKIEGRVTSTMLAPSCGMPMRFAAPGEGWRRVPVSGNIHEMVNLD